MNDDVAEEKTIHLPQPEGHRRGCLRYRNGLMQEIDMSPEDLAAEVKAFLADPERLQLELRDAKYGDLYVMQRNAAQEELLDVLVCWVKNPAPQLGARPGGVSVVRQMPMDPAVMRAAEAVAEQRRRAG
jgi:hypothetical protein